MRHTMAGTIAGLAMIAATTGMGTAPAMACYAGCATGFSFNNGYGCGVGFGGCGGYGTAYYGYAYRDQLPDPSGPRSYVGPQYYYVNQGPYYTGPGVVAPAPAYQERAVNGWYSAYQPYYYGYYGGPYANATSHLYDGAYVGGPAIYSYRWHRRHGYYSRTYYRSRPRSTKYYYAGSGYAGPRTQGERMRIY